jgi:hypothetical protein
LAVFQNAGVVKASIFADGTADFGGINVSHGGGNVLTSLLVGSGLTQNLTGGSIIAIGFNTLSFCKGSQNVGIGAYAGSLITTGINNVVIGANAFTVDGGTSKALSDNTIIGANAGYDADDCNSCTIIGANAGMGLVGFTLTNCTLLGARAAPQISGVNEVVLGDPSITDVVTFGTLNAPKLRTWQGEPLYLSTSTISTASAVGFIFDTDNTLSTAGAKLFSIRNASAEKVYIDKDGNAKFNTVYIGLGNNNNGTNLAIGAGALAANTTGTNNLALGFNALAGNTNRGGNIAIGAYALEAASGSSNSTAIGVQALQTTGTVTNNVAIGYQAMLTTSNLGSNNIALGASALSYNGTGAYNVAIGINAMQATTLARNNGNSNTAIGYASLRLNTSGANNIAIGSAAMESNDSGANNVVIGNTTLGSSLNSSGNVAIGSIVFGDSSVAVDNVAIGNEAAYYAIAYEGADVVDTPSKCIYIGSKTLASSISPTNEIVIGAEALGNGSNTITLGNSSITAVHTSGLITSGGSPVSRKVAVPATAGATGSVGDWAADASWLYICTATNTWQRTAITLATW